MVKKVRGLEYLKSLLDDEQFIASIKEARESDEFTRQIIPSKILIDHGIPSRYWKVIDHYIDTDELREDLIEEPVKVVYRGDGGVIFKLSHDITQPELQAYIRKHWQSDVKPKLDLVGGSRRRRLTVQPYPDRDREVYADYLNKKKSRLTYEAIGERHNIDARTVRRIVKKFEKRT